MADVRLMYGSCVAGVHLIADILTRYLQMISEFCSCARTDYRGHLKPECEVCLVPTLFGRPIQMKRHPSWAAICPSVGYLPIFTFVKKG